MTESHIHEIKGRHVCPAHGAQTDVSDQGECRADCGECGRLCDFVEDGDPLEALRAELARVRAERDEARAAGWNANVEASREILARAEAAEARVAALEGALEPFADACRPGGFGSAVSMYHWQTARALLAPPAEAPCTEHPTDVPGSPDACGGGA